MAASFRFSFNGALRNTRTSLRALKGCYVEPSLAGASPGDQCQFERTGYFCVDPDSSEGKLVFNRTVTLRDSWAKVAKQQKTRRP